MKRLSAFCGKVFLVLALSAVFLLACRSDEAPDALDNETSYAFGMLMANMLRGEMGIEGLIFDYDAFRDGFRDFNEGRETRISQDMAIDRINAALIMLQARMDEERWLEGERNHAEGEAFLAENRLRSGVRTTASGLQYEVIVQGSGARPGPNDVVRVHYEGTFIDGTVFDSSFARGFPVEFPLGGVIPGWTEGLQLMSEGGTYMLFVPPELAYGVGGAGIIPPNSTLIFRVELLSVIH